MKNYMTMKWNVIGLLFLAFWFATGSMNPLAGQQSEQELPDTAAIRQSLDLIGLPFTSQEILQMQRGVADLQSSLGALHGVEYPNSWVPALVFNPVPPGFEYPVFPENPEWPSTGTIDRPDDETALAFLPVAELSKLIATRKITSTELTKLYIKRLKEYKDTLLCVVTLTEELALRQAAEADREIAAGHYRGPLHGIPYGIKDLMAVPGYPTTWGAGPYKEQVIGEAAHVVNKLNEAGAVLVAKLTSGALAMGDVWFGGTTRNPWNLNRGSSGSSAGPASATAAGLVAFAIGTETLGSIVSPSTRCGVTGLRPTFGRVGRTGTMALSWSMDKIGPICRTALDCAMVFDAIHGKDPNDLATTNTGFTFKPLNSLKGLRVGYLKSLFGMRSPNRASDSTALETFRKLGADLIPVELPDDIPVQALRIILSAEAAAAFDDLTRSNRDTLLVAQNDYAWPNTFRTARLIPAVEYIQANRLRERLIIETNRVMKEYDLVITPSFAGNQLTLTNLTGHPCLVIPDGFDRNGNPLSISLIANLYREDLLCEAGYLYQEKTGIYHKHPPLFSK
jgi:Asp-tRNA(Asn)/Glu-tRNA(Gln) amidotransferase A subunit family amidase